MNQELGAGHGHYRPDYGKQCEYNVLWTSWAMNTLSATERGSVMKTITQNFSFCVRLIIFSTLIVTIAGCERHEMTRNRKKKLDAQAA